MAEINIYDYDFLLGASINAQQQVFDAVANAGPINLTGTTSQIVGFDLYGNPMPKNVGGDANGAGLAFVGDTLTATLPQNLKPLGTPTFAGLTLTNQTANRLLFASAAQAVASTGITYDAGTVTIGSVQSVDFATSPTNAITGQRLQWNDTEGTLELGLKGGSTAVHLGLDHLTRITNKTGAGLLRSEFRVIRAGNSQGVNRIGGVLAQANSEANSTDVLGIVCENISNNQEGFILTWGELSGIDTTGAAYGETWNEGDPLYLSPSTYGGKAGALTKTRPQAPDHLVIVGYVTSKNANNGRILVHIQPSWETAELHDVQFGASMPLAGSLLIRDATLNVWRPARLSAGSNVTITNADGAITIAAAPGMVYPGAGIPVSTGSAWGTSKASPTGDIVGTTDGQILSNKTLSGPAITGQLTLSNGTGAVGQVVTRDAAGLLWANVTPGVTNGDKGDITVSNAGTGSENWAIDPGAVTYAKMQNVTPGRLLGRATSPTGSVEELTPTQALDLIGSTAQGDILYRAASPTGWTRLPAGTVGQVLQTGGPGANPSWASISASPGGANQQVQFNDSGAFNGDAGLLFNKISHDLTLGVAGTTNQLRLVQTGGSTANYVALQAPVSVGASIALTLPGTTGSVNQVLTTDGTGILSWSTPSGGDSFTNSIQSVAGSDISAAESTRYFLDLSGLTDLRDFVLPAPTAVGKQIQIVITNGNTTRTVTTGSVSAGSTSLTVASATGLSTNQRIRIDEAGPLNVYATNHITTINSISGTTVTLADAASVSVTNVAVVTLNYELLIRGQRVGSDWITINGGNPSISVTVNTTTDTFTSVGHNLNEGDPVYFTGTTLPGGINANTIYYVRRVAIETNDNPNAGRHLAFTVSATRGGSTVDITSNGTSVSVIPLEWSRLFIAKESVTLTATSLTNWQVTSDGRIPIVMRLGTTSPQQFISGTAATRVAFNTVVLDNSASALVGRGTTGNSIMLRRGNPYLLTAALRFKQTTSAWPRFSLWVRPQTVGRGFAIPIYNEVVGAVAGAETVPGLGLVTTAFFPRTPTRVNAGWELLAAQNSGGDLDTNANPYPHLAVTEVLT